MHYIIHIMILRPIHRKNSKNLIRNFDQQRPATDLNRRDLRG